MIACLLHEGHGMWNRLGMGEPGPGPKLLPSTFGETSDGVEDHQFNP